MIYDEYRFMIVGLTIIYILITLFQLILYWENPIFKKYGSKVEHPNRTIRRAVLNIVASIIMSMSWVVILLIVTPINWYIQKVNAYKEDRGALHE